MNGLHCILRVKSRCLLKIEALDTMIRTIDDVRIIVTIEGRGEWIVQLIHKLDQNKKNGLHCKTKVKGKCLSTEYRRVEHDDSAH